MKKEISIYRTDFIIFVFHCVRKSSDNEFSDFDYQTVYFANQYGFAYH